jgi:metal transporter CNNM
LRACALSLTHTHTLLPCSLDTNQLDILRQSGGAKERVWAERILAVRRDGNLLLCTLLWANMSVNSLLSIVIADLTSGLVGFIVSTCLIVVLGEIIPQASCQRHGLRVGSFFVPAVRVLIFLFYPFAKPIAAMLDRMLGAEIGVLYKREEVRACWWVGWEGNCLGGSP